MLITRRWREIEEESKRRRSEKVPSTAMGRYNREKTDE
jgi:hypothetical protein